MSEERWVVTHATESGATRMWWVDEEVADWLRSVISKPRLSWQIVWYGQRTIGFNTTTGRALIWLTPGQSLTVERSNG